MHLIATYNNANKRTPSTKFSVQEWCLPKLDHGPKMPVSFNVKVSLNFILSNSILNAMTFVHASMQKLLISNLYSAEKFLPCFSFYIHWSSCWSIALWDDCTIRH